MPTPHAVSTTLCFPALLATAKVTAIMTSRAAAVLVRVIPNGPAGMPLTLVCRTARIWSTPIRPSSKASALPARYRRQTRTCSAVRSLAISGRLASKLSSQARMVRT